MKVLMHRCDDDIPDEVALLLQLSAVGQLAHPSQRSEVRQSGWRRHFFLL